MSDKPFRLQDVAPTPWSGKHQGTICDCTGAERMWIGLPIGDSHKEMFTSYRDEIIRRVNAHGPLVEALRGFLKLLSHMPHKVTEQECDCECCKGYRALRAAGEDV